MEREFNDPASGQVQLLDIPWEVVGCGRSTGDARSRGISLAEQSPPIERFHPGNSHSRCLEDAAALMKQKTNNLPNELRVRGFDLSGKIELGSLARSGKRRVLH